MAAGLGSIVAPFIGSQLWALFNPRMPFLVSVVVAAAVVLPLALIQESHFESTAL
jgi:hypothetical protein